MHIYIGSGAGQWAKGSWKYGNQSRDYDYDFTENIVQDWYIQISYANNKY